MESAVHYSNVSLIDPVTNAPVKTSWRYLEDGSKVRITRGKLASQSIVPRPEVLKQRRKPLPVEHGPKDTDVQARQEVTHVPGDLPLALKDFLSKRKKATDALNAPTIFSRRKWSLFYNDTNQSRSFASSCFSVPAELAVPSVESTRTSL